jgi:hypothetical protein
VSNLPIYEMLAQAFASEGVDTVFNLMGDGNISAPSFRKPRNGCPESTTPAAEYGFRARAYGAPRNDRNKDCRASCS